MDTFGLADATELSYAEQRAGGSGPTVSVVEVRIVEFNATDNFVIRWTFSADCDFGSVDVEKLTISNAESPVLLVFGSNWIEVTYGGVSSPPDDITDYELLAGHDITSAGGEVLTRTGSVVALDAPTIILRRKASGQDLWLESDTNVFEGEGTDDAEPDDLVQEWTSVDDSMGGMAQPTLGARPTLKVNIFNGLPGILFQTNKELVASVPDSSTRTIFLIGYFLTVNNNRLWSMGGSSSILANGSTFFWYSDEVGGSKNAGGTATNPTLLTIVVNSGSSVNIYVNGVPVAGLGAEEFDPDDNLIHATEMYLGSSGGSEFGHCYAGALISLSVVVPSEEERTVVNEYLMEKYLA